MAAFSDCMPCRYGMHGDHVPVPGPVADDVIGGWICPCEGDCAERNRERIESERRRVVGVAEQVDPAAFDLLRGFAHGEA
jgi:hypothetical protein